MRLSWWNLPCGGALSADDALLALHFEHEIDLAPPVPQPNALVLPVEHCNPYTLHQVAPDDHVVMRHDRRVAGRWDEEPVFVHHSSQEQTSVHKPCPPNAGVVCLRDIGLTAERGNLYPVLLRRVSRQQAAICTCVQQGRTLSDLSPFHEAQTCLVVVDHFSRLLLRELIRAVGAHISQRTDVLAVTILVNLDGHNACVGVHQVIEIVLPTCHDVHGPVGFRFLRIGRGGR